MRQLNKIKSFVTGQPPIYLVNDGKPVEEMIIRHKDIFFNIKLDAETGDPTGDFNWSRSDPMTNVPIREFYTAVREED